MQRLDRATLLELEWRDFLFWPVARPAGFLYEFIRMPLARALCIFLSPVFRLCFSRAPAPETIAKEILTLANWVTLYGLFLWVELVYLIAAWSRGYDSIRLYGITDFLWQPQEPTVRIMAFLILEIFLTDLLDGPIARVNNSVTALGTILDHTRDYLAVFTALFFLFTFTITSGDTLFVILECAVIGEFTLVMIYHQKLLRLFMRSEGRSKELSSIKGRILLMRRFALEAYQTSLTGRIQFWTLGASIGSGLFHYATQNVAWTWLFVMSLVLAIMATSYYLYELWGEHYKKWQESMHERSQRLKERLAEKMNIE